MTADQPCAPEGAQDPHNDLSLEQQLDYDFKTPPLLVRALTHPSLRQRRSDPSYERLEFLGDRVLGLLVAELLMDRFPDFPEGELARRLAVLVSGSTLADVARSISLETFIKVGPGEIAAGTQRRESVMADCLEAIIGAMYRDGGLDAARGFVWGKWSSLVETVEPRVAKTELQEWLQGRGLPLPEYRVIERDGPAHEPLFTIRLTVSGQPPVTATGTSKRAAELEAASQMLDLIGDKA